MKKLKDLLSHLTIVALIIILPGCSGGSKSNNNTKTKSFNYVEPKEFSIDWNSFEEGDYPKAYGGLSVIMKGGNKVLSTPAKGKYSFDISNPFPINFRLLITMSGNTWNSGDHIVTVTLMSPNGDLSYFIAPHPVGGGLWKLGFFNSNISGEIKSDNDNLTDIELKKNDDVYKLYLSNKLICSYQINDFYQFTGLRISVLSYGNLDDGFSFSKISLNSM